MDVKRGVLRAFAAGTYTATIQLHGSLQNAVEIPVSRAIAAEQTAGRSQRGRAAVLA